METANNIKCVGVCVGYLMKWLQGSDTWQGRRVRCRSCSATWHQMIVVHLYLVLGFNHNKKQVKMWLHNVDLGNWVMYPEHFAGNKV